MDTPDIALGRVVTEALEAAGISSNAAAKQTGIPRTTLLRRLDGLSPFTTTELGRVATLLGTTASALMYAAEGGEAA